MLMAYSQDIFPNEYVPTVFDNFVTNIVVNGKTIRLGLWDTAGQEEYARLRMVSYPMTDVFIACFSVNDRKSFDNIKICWIPEVQHHCPRTPIILVGTKKDLRDEFEKHPRNFPDKTSRDFITTYEGVNLAKSLKNCSEYTECSALNKDGLNQLFDTAVSAVISPKVAKPPGWINWNKCRLF